MTLVRICCLAVVAYTGFIGTANASLQISFQGTFAASSAPFTLTLMLENGATSLASQTWGESDVTWVKLDSSIYQIDAQPNHALQFSMATDASGAIDHVHFAEFQFPIGTDGLSGPEKPEIRAAAVRKTDGLLIKYDQATIDALAAANNGAYWSIDAFVPSANVPEPASLCAWSLLGCSVAIGRLVRRRRRSARTA